MLSINLILQLKKGRPTESQETQVESGKDHVLSHTPPTSMHSVNAELIRISWGNIELNFTSHTVKIHMPVCIFTTRL